MCWLCGDPTCIDGKKCRNARARNDLLNSNTFRGAVRRVERATDQKVTYAPGVPWDGRRASNQGSLWGRKRDPDPDPDPDGAGILV